MSLTSNFILEHLYEQWEGECGQELYFAPVFCLKNLEMLVHQLYLVSKSHAPLNSMSQKFLLYKEGRQMSGAL